MAAGLGFKDFTTGEVLTAADVDGYLMQGVWVFASAAARDAAVTSPQEGNFAYLKDTNVTTYYTGSAWANLDTTGMTNPMTTTGDIIYSSSGSTPARLGIGSTGNVLTVAGGVPSWAAPAGGGGLTLLQTLSLSGSSTTSSSLSGSYKNLVVYVKNTYGNILEDMTLRFNSDTGNNYYWQSINGTGGTAGAGGAAATSSLNFGLLNDTATVGKQTNGSFRIYNYTDTDTVYYEARSFARDNSNNRNIVTSGIYDNSAAITTITFLASTATFTAGTAYIYGES